MFHIKEIFRRIGTDIRLNAKALLIILVYMAASQFIFHTVCPLRILTGRLCPACGLTRAAFLVLSLRFRDAWNMNPAIYLWIPFLLYLCLCRYIWGKKPALALPLTITVCLATYGIFLWKDPDDNMRIFLALPYIQCYNR